MSEQEKKAQTIHKFLIILAIILTSALLLEWKMTRNEPEGKRYIIIPTETREIDFDESQIDVSSDNSFYTLNCYLPDIDKKEKIQTGYKDDILIIKVPKKTAKSKI